MEPVEKEKSKIVARPWWRATLLILLLLVALSLVAAVASSSLPLSPGWDLALLLAAIGLVLSGAVAAAFLLARRRALDTRRPIPLLPFLAGAYLLPLLLTLLPAMLNHQPLPLDFIAAWVFLWQAVALAVLALGLARRSARAESLPAWLLKNSAAAFARARGWLIPAALSGGGLGLSAAFLVNLLPFWQPHAATLSPFLVGANLLLGVLIAPWAEEVFYRRELLTRWQLRLGVDRAALASALLFALLLMRPWLLLPACLLGMVNAWLARRSGSLLPAIVAHAAFNLLALPLGWWLVL